MTVPSLPSSGNTRQGVTYACQDDRDVHASSCEFSIKTNQQRCFRTFLCSLSACWIKFILQDESLDEYGIVSYLMIRFLDHFWICQFIFGIQRMCLRRCSKSRKFSKYAHLLSGWDCLSWQGMASVHVEIVGVDHFPILTSLTRPRSMMGGFPDSNILCFCITNCVTHLLRYIS